MPVLLHNDSADIQLLARQRQAESFRSCVGLFTSVQLAAQLHVCTDNLAMSLASVPIGQGFMC